VTSICSSSANVTCRPDDSHWSVPIQASYLSTKSTAVGDCHFTTVHRIRINGNQIKYCNHFLGQTLACTAPLPPRYTF
jgi:hypothetical protein